MKKKIAVFDAKQYDIDSFEKYQDIYEFVYYKDLLSINTVALAKGCDAVICFVNDELNADVLQKLAEYNIHGAFLRCAGYNNVDLNSSFKNKIHIARVPAYSPYAIAEHAMTLILALNRRIHKAYLRTREFNFNLESLTGFDLHGKTIGVIGTGKIGRVFMDICNGFGMNVLCYDPYPIKNSNYQYVALDELYAKSDIISLHCPLNNDTYHMINNQSINKMKKGVMLINTSRGGLIDSKDLLDALKNKHVASVGLDVYEEEANLFYHDNSFKIIEDDVLALLISLPNVLLTSHQAYLTKEALENIAEATIKNLDEYFSNAFMENELCYKCEKATNKEACYKNRKGRCF